MPDGMSINALGLAAKFESKLRRFEQAVRTHGAPAVQAQMLDVHHVIVATAPVDTGRYRASWPLPTERGTPLTWGTGTTLDYAPTLEYGGYQRAGPRTVQLGGGNLGEGFVASAGIYSRQAPLGHVRRALGQAGPPFRARIMTVVRQAWGA